MKRTRRALEEELQRKQSPYVFYGTPLPPFDPDVRDDGSYVPVWQQEVRDERGRKRLHGAFTGGFSAGYFNTVGSKEGWTPQAFVSSRTNRANAQQRAEDYMDEEDLADAEDAKRLETASGFAGLGGAAGRGPARRGDALMDLLRPGGEEWETSSMGIKLLQKMGWRVGQGLGPKVRRKARADDDGGGGEGADGGDEEGAEHLFAPSSNSPMVALVQKHDFKGLGYEGELALTRPAQQQHGDAALSDDDGRAPSFVRAKSKVATQKTRKGGIGVGVLNDTGSDDEDPYELGPKLSYNRTIGGDRVAKKKPVGGANPLLASRPVFTKKVGGKVSKLRKCHDGRLPLDGFVLSNKTLELSTYSKHMPPVVPEGWVSRLQKMAKSQTEGWQSTAEAAKASSLDPAARSTMLGEQTLPGKSIFDFISSAARDRLAAAAGRVDLPQGRGEDAPEGYRLTEEAKQKQLQDSVPVLPRNVALEALQRGKSGWMPYAEDEKKRARYRSFLETKAGLRDGLPERAPGARDEDWRNEMHEFAQAAEVFRPITGAMASRFTTSSQGTYEGTREPSQGDAEMPLITKPTAKPEDPAEAAAKIGMYGPMTRSSMPFHPTKLLCKRFNVRPPTNVLLDPGEGNEGEGSATVREVLPKRAVEKMMQDAALRRFASAGFESVKTETSAEDEGVQDAKPAASVGSYVAPPVVDAERNEALEAERPGEAVFKAIFGDDDDDD